MRSLSLPCLLVACSFFGLSACEVASPRSTNSSSPASSSSEKSGSAQQTRFANLDLLEQFATTGRMRMGRPANFTWLPDNSGVLFTRARSAKERTQDLFIFDVQSASERRLLSTDDVLGGKTETLSPEEAARRERMRLSASGIARFSLSPDGNKLLIPLSGSVFVIDVQRARAGESQVAPLRIEGAIDAKFSPDSSKIAFVRSGEVFVKQLDQPTSPELQVSSGATVASGGTISNGEAEFVAQEEMDRTEGFWWSPNSDAIAYQQNDTKGVQTFTIADAGDPASEPQQFPYPRAGKANVDVSLWVATLPTSATPAAQSRVMWDRAKYPYLARVAWGKAEGQATSHLNVLVQDRLQREQHVLAVQLNGQSQLATQSVLQEQDAAWLNLHNFDPQWVSLEGQNAPAMWWLTEREGGWIPQLLAPNGSVIAELAESALPLGGARNVMGVSNKGRTLWVGVGTAPTRAAVMRIDAAPDAQGAWKLTASEAFGDADENALHSFTPSPDGLGGVLQVARNGDALRWTVQRANMTTMNGILGLNYAPVGEAITSYAPTPVLQPQVELVRLQAAERTYECAIIRPKDFVRGKKYPVINFVYAGPGVNIVSADTRRYVLEQWYAQQGFIVVSIDGRGTPGKGRAWERAIAGNLIDVAMADQVDALNVLCRTYPEMDARRIGVYGWSFGGYFSLLAPTLRPDVFKAAAAGAPVADWRDYDTHYTERYMGVPAELGENDVSAPFVASGLNKAGYDAANALTHVDKLASPLLILHGTADDNVYFTHSARMADALTRAGKTYEFIPLLSQTHGVSSPKLVQRMHEQIAWFFMRHLQDKH